MGVTSLWSVIESVGESHSLSEDSGVRVAVDLASWIVPGLKAARQTNVSDIYVMIRTVFFRTVELLKLGLRPVFVLDGQAPTVKYNTLDQRRSAAGYSSGSGDRSRVRYREIANKCRELFHALGVPCVESPGEAEKMCACLNSNQLVDACICNDSDIFLYGAQTVYRNFDLKKGGSTVTRYKMADIREKLGLDRRCLVVFALLSGSDYGSGLDGVGVKKTQELIQSMNGSSTPSQDDDVLHRIMNWRNDTKLQETAARLELLQRTTKPTHCSNCSHLGSVSQHKARCCDVCGVSNRCTTSSSSVCPCVWHREHNALQPHLVELGIREKALKAKDFPQKQVVDEFLVDIVPSVKLNWKMPKSLTQVEFLLKTLLKWDIAEVKRKLLPVLVHMQLHGIMGMLSFEPVRIEKSFKKHFKPCFKTWWRTKDADPADGEFEVDVEDKLFAAHYPSMSSQHEKTGHPPRTPSSAGKKQKLKVDDNQKTIDSMFKVVKRKLYYPEGSSSSTVKKTKNKLKTD